MTRYVVEYFDPRGATVERVVAASPAEAQRRFAELARNVVLHDDESYEGDGSFVPGRIEWHAEGQPGPHVRGTCRFCGHHTWAHDGLVRQSIRDANPRVKWTTTACSQVSCVCRTYES